MRLTVHDSIGDIDPDQWNRIAGDAYPFLQHDFLRIAEDSGCVSPETGWTPRHLTLSDERGVAAGLLLYEKTHSWGEFVFDWAWANAYHRAGLPYYPKLVSATPFTPATCPRLLLRDDVSPSLAGDLATAAVEYARDGRFSSLHILFPTAAELPVLKAAGLEQRRDCQFHWHNQDYADFDAFLASFNSRKRKKARRDRRHVAESGITFRHLRGGDIGRETWETIYQLINVTFLLRGSSHYFSADFFMQIGESLPDSILVVLAEQDGRAVAAAVFFEGRDTLYGRYWGSLGDYNALHFETCYYQGIEHCIREGLSTFEPGTQGEHKISRGFLPTETHSAHWLAHPEFFAAIREYLELEGQDVERYMRAVDEYSPFRQGERRS